MLKCWRKPIALVALLAFAVLAVGVPLALAAEKNRIGCRWSSGLSDKHEEPRQACGQSDQRYHAREAGGAPGKGHGGQSHEEGSATARDKDQQDYQKSFGQVSRRENRFRPEDNLSQEKSSNPDRQQDHRQDCRRDQEVSQAQPGRAMLRSAAWPGSCLCA